MNNQHVDSINGNCWCDLTDYSSLLDELPQQQIDLYWNNQLQKPKAMDVTLSDTTSHVSHIAERESPKKRGRDESYGVIGTKACRERMRREKLNDRFSELSAILELGKPVKTDKSAILDDAIRTLKQLKTESSEYKEMNERLLEEIQTLKAEKNELREEKMILKEDKRKIEEQIKTMNISSNDVKQVNSPAYGANKTTMFPSYGFVPMWQYLPQWTYDTSQDHELRPPAA